jgi:hypothetical protein
MSRSNGDWNSTRGMLETLNGLDEAQFTSQKFT